MIVLLGIYNHSILKSSHNACLCDAEFFYNRRDLQSTILSQWLWWQFNWFTTLNYAHNETALILLCGTLALRSSASRHRLRPSRRARRPRSRGDDLTNSSPEAPPYTAPEIQPSSVRLQSWTTPATKPPSSMFDFTYINHSGERWGSLLDLLPWYFSVFITIARGRLFFM